MQNKLNSWMTIGDLAKRSDVSVATLRFYEEKELIWSIRTEGNQRRYQRAMLRRIAIVKVAQQVGLSLAEIKQAFTALPKQKMASKDDWQKMSQQWQQDLDQRIIKLLQLRNQLNWCIGCGCLSQEQCPLYNPDDIMANESAGAHFKDIVLKFSDLDQAKES
ncbi:redox-sensitive transcriptional activator SoxR [Acinetobacter shaoyimingii]|uniref:Redox-sensitive transcriptional activator SoxR n=1 Tax=Acinetobacter shaoyimingii TaxID=2715164 RepID=A0A6G8RT68_9GAMM|nr:redox-sensitive transcriptional activator SoxR [Acinetobacter shaoyimingii]QIO05020.1 redox-sensitive transcriptional activator SoxR [Acinetobacter shaoyimingii]